jgi:glycosyltransferase involved in cell wall biosynthesis
VVIGYIGRFVPEKGVLDLVDACATLDKPFTLLMIGGGALEEDIRRRAEEKGIGDKLRLVISIPHSEVPKYVNAMDMLVLPSYTVAHWKEQLSDNRIFRPTQIYTGHPPRDYVPIDQRS